MTIATTSGTQFTIDEVVRLSYVMAGLLEENQTLASIGGGGIARQFLQVLMKDLQAMGVSARARAFYELELTADDFEYTMPADVLDVFGDAAYIDASVTDTSRAGGETLVQQISRDDRQAQSAKDATGRPVNYFCDRETTPPKVVLWPIPDEAGRVRFNVHRYLADSTIGSATLDLEDYWCSYVMYALANMLAEAKSMPADKVGRLQGQANAKLRYARSMSTSRTDMQIVVTHGSGRRR